MAARYFNWKLAIVLLVGVVVFAGAAFALRKWQRNTRAEEALPRGKQAYEQQDWDTAAEQFARYLTVHRDDEAVLLKYADAQVKRRPVQRANWLQAVNAYRVLLRLDNDHAEATARLTELYLGMGAWREAELLARPYLQRHDDPNLSRMWGTALAQQRKFGEAEEVFENLLRDHPDQIAAYEMIGSWAAARPEDFNRDPNDWFDDMVAKNPQSALAYIARARFHLLIGDEDDARADWERAQQEDLSDTRVRLRLTGLLIGVREFDKAKEHLAALEADASGDLAFWRTWAELALRLNAKEDMVRVATTGLEQLQPQPWDFMPLAAELFIRAGQFEKGRECISQMRNKELDLRRVAFLEGLLARGEGRLAEAVEHWQDAIAQEYKQHRSPLGGTSVPLRMMVSSAFSQMGDLRSAMNELRVLTSEMPDYWEGHLSLARLYSQTSNWAQVIEEARAVQRLVSEHPEAALLELQARTTVLGAAGTAAGDNARAWKDIETRLAALDGKVAGRELELELLRVQVAMTQDKLAEARAIFDPLKSEYSSDLRVALLEAQLLFAEDNVPGAVESLRETVERFPQAVEPVRRLALFVNQQEGPEPCESVVKQAMARMDQPQARRVLGLFLGELYGLWQQEDKLYQWLTDLARQFPDDIQIKRRLLICGPILKDVQRAQTLVDEIKSLEGETGWQWRYEQARVWLSSEDANDVYAQATRLLQENLLSNPDDRASRMLLALAHEKTGRLQLAVSVYREALSRWPDNVLVVARTVDALQRAGQSDEARRILDDAKRRDLKHPALDELEARSQRTAARDHVQHGDLELASAILEELVEEDPNDISAGLELVRVMMQQGKLGDAEVLFAEVKAKAPESFWVKETEIRLQLSRGDGEAAIRVCDEVIESSGMAVAYVLRAQTHAILQANEKAMADFSRAIETEPNAPGLWVERARFLRSLGRMDEAVEDSRKALDLAPKNLLVQKFVMELYFMSGRRALIEEAEAMLDRALASDDHSGDVQLKMYKVRRLLPRNTRASLEQAERLLEEVTAAEPTLVAGWESLGRLKLRQGNPRAALDIALRGLAHNKQDKQLLLLKASAEAQAAQSAALAIPTLRQLSQRYPDDAVLQRTLASTLYNSGDKTEARSLLEGQMRAEPNSPAPMITLVDLLASEGAWAEVREQLTSWLDRHPDDDNTRMRVAELLMARGAGDTEPMKMAEGLLQTVLERNPKAVGALGVLAMLTQSTGRVEESIGLNRRILELDPNNLIAMNNMAWSLCEEKGQYQEALELANRALSIYAEYTDMLDTRGVIHYRLGAADPTHYEKAEADFKQCIDWYPAWAPAGVLTRFHLARVYEKTDRKAEALQELQKALDAHEKRGVKLPPAEHNEATRLRDQLQGG